MLNKISINAHSSVRIGASTTVYVDPFQLTEEKHDADFILITHPHYDHLSPEDFKKAAKSNTVFIVPESCEKEALEAGIPKAHLYTLAPGENVEMPGLIVEAVPAWNTRPYHQEIFRWVGYVIHIDGWVSYVAGDTYQEPWNLGTFEHTNDTIKTADAQERSNGFSSARTPSTSIGAKNERAKRRDKSFFIR